MGPVAYELVEYTQDMTNSLSWYLQPPHVSTINHEAFSTEAMTTVKITNYKEFNSIQSEQGFVSLMI
jgi:hypothetical protein